MSITITLNETLTKQLHARATLQQRSLEEEALHILREALEPVNKEPPTPEEVVAKIAMTPASSTNIRPPLGSLHEALQQSAADPDFDLETWRREWAAVECEMKAITRANDIAEGRR